MRDSQAVDVRRLLAGGAVVTLASTFDGAEYAFYVDGVEAGRLPRVGLDFSQDTLKAARGRGESERARDKEVERGGEGKSGGGAGGRVGGREREREGNGERKR